MCIYVYLDNFSIYLKFKRNTKVEKRTLFPFTWRCSCEIARFMNVVFFLYGNVYRGFSVRFPSTQYRAGPSRNGHLGIYKQQLIQMTSISTRIEIQKNAILKAYDIPRHRLMVSSRRRIVTERPAISSDVIKEPQ